MTSRRASPPTTTGLRPPRIRNHSGDESRLRAHARGRRCEAQPQSLSSLPARWEAGP